MIGGGVTYFIHGPNGEGSGLAGGGLVDADCGWGGPDEGVDEGVEEHLVGDLVGVVGE